MSQREDNVVEITGTSRTVVRSLVMSMQKLEEEFAKDRQELDAAIQQVTNASIRAAGHPEGLRWNLQFDGGRVFLVHVEPPAEEGE